MNIILVSNATARARTLTLDWRHWALGGLVLAVVLVACTGVFNFATLKYAAAIQHPSLQAIVLADQRQEALKTQQMVHGHFSAMAVAAASGKVIEAGVHQQYGKIHAIDHGNGLVSRYAHASEVFINEGDLVVRGQRVATVGSTGRSTGPHPHSEVRLNGVPQNPVRFLRSAG